MVKHIVMLDFKDENKKENLEKVKTMLEALMESVPTLKSMEVGINFSEEDRAMDLSLYSEFEDKAGLEAYAIHPAHLEVVAFIKTVATASKVSDYTV
ncbi:MAG: Stress responsive alpha-beta barrel domain protein Dabb [uncultured Sulfurovum sp.]|uniref:Stress responsive alpha-beta barrel domain protein Dabb n=1 Tax=uncultured Sulfurovum sp. TaxID=269237 RepID=A0A6S6SZY7_9BACT|nr:MAG: Stress responsive alpha-beta barrel domain protein Dabb [uncultured Sulfurovum sp.]